MSLLHQITRAVGEHQDLASIFQVVIRTLEDQMPVDFACMCLYDEAVNDVMIASVGLHGAEMAKALALTEQAHLDIGGDCVGKLKRGVLIYEPDTLVVNYVFPQHLAQGGVRAMVAVPLMVDGELYGVLVVTRVPTNSFSSGECEFLTHLTEHVGAGRAASHFTMRCRVPTTICVKRRRASCSRNVCVRWDRWRAASRTTLTTGPLADSHATRRPSVP